MSQFDYINPHNGNPLVFVDTNNLCDPETDMSFQRVDGIWRFLLPERAPVFSTFMDDYEKIRRKEGRGSSDAQWYRALPFEDNSERFSEDWRIRAKSYQTLIDQAVQPHVKYSGRNLNILDLGAGNGWLANRLSEQHHQVAAVDLLTNTFDGLGAHIYYNTQFVPIQAEYDRLPLAEKQFDIVIFNGSLHYSLDYVKTIEEAVRVLHPEGLLVIMDSPVYHDESSGKQMVKEREAHFERTYGTRSNALDSEHFLTYNRLDELSDTLKINWKTHTPAYGWRWALRPWNARLRGRREPARFHIIVGRLNV